MNTMNTTQLNIKTINSIVNSMSSLKDNKIDVLVNSLDIDLLREYLFSFSSNVILPFKRLDNVDERDLVKYGVRFFLMPGFTLSGYYRKRHRTKLSHPCWFSTKKDIQVLSVREAMIKHPLYMIWVYRNLSINWSVYCIANFEYLVKKHNL
jgi:hypothetical protein